MEIGFDYYAHNCCFDVSIGLAATLITINSCMM